MCGARRLTYRYAWPEIAAGAKLCQRPAPVAGRLRTGSCSENQNKPLFSIQTNHSKSAVRKPYENCCGPNRKTPACGGTQRTHHPQPCAASDASSSPSRPRGQSAAGARQGGTARPRVRCRARAVPGDRHAALSRNRDRAATVPSRSSDAHEMPASRGRGAPCLSLRSGVPFC